MTPDVIGVFVPIVAIIFGVAVAAVRIVATHRYRTHRADLRHRERLALIDKGLEPPPEAAEYDAVAARPRPLLRGLILSFVGIALIATSYFETGLNLPFGLGFVTAAAGLGYLVYYVVEGRHEAAAGRSAAVPPDAAPGV